MGRSPVPVLRGLFSRGQEVAALLATGNAGVGSDSIPAGGGGDNRLAHRKSRFSGSNAQPARPPSAHHPLVRYSCGLGLVLGAALLTNAVQPIIAPAAFPFFLASIILTATLFGLGPGLMVTAIAGLLAETQFMPPHGEIGSWLRLSLWWAEGLLVCVITERHRRAQRQTEAHARDVRESEERFRVAMEAYITARNKDETERAKLETQLRQAHRMEAVGTLAGGIAHDFNNMLTAILSNAQLLLMRPDRPAEEATDLTEIVNSGIRAAGLTRQLLMFSRRQMVDAHVVSVYITLREMGPMFRRLIAEDITMNMHADPDAGSVWADQSQVEQLMLNLVVNARDAMPHGGRIKITARPHIITGRTDVPDGRYVELCVEDNGEGIAPDVMPHVFEPFYTTKGSKGTGLGLSTVYGIVQQARGRVFVESQVGQGTKFTVWLPALDQGTAVGILDVVPDKVDDACRVLLVEDELSVQQVLRRALVEWHYDVITADNGLEAQDVLRTTKVDLVVTDVVMPEMGGRQLGEFIAREYPDLPILYMTGYTTDDMIRRGIEQGRTNFIQKPFDFKMLILKIQEVLQNQTAKN